MLDALQFETEIKGGAIKTLTDIQELLGKISQKTTITIDVQGIQEFQQFVQSNDFKDIAKNISSAFGGAKAKNVESFFTNLRTEIEKVKAALKSDDYSAFMTQIGQLTQQFASLNTEYQKFLKGSGAKTGDDVIANMSQRLKEVEKAIAQLDPAYKKLQKQQDKLEKQQDRLAEKQKKLADRMKKTTKEADNQSHSMNGLTNMMNKYLSIYGIFRFAKEMANITGELELQKRSLEVIIGNAGTANELYGQIRDMSQMSPYTFQDLMKSTRQLAAFGIETKDLYGTMKALSDIGAGLSVDVQRLILAYGHTRSYGYLSGIQNRQFETAGIDMIGGLADRYNRLADAEERAGRAAQHVTRRDIFKRMSKRDISFEDVNAVIMDLDREGGRFYNMQEKQYETLGGQLRNLKNNWNIMMSEMGQMSMGMLKGGVGILNNLTGNWEKYANVIKGLIVPLGLLKAAIWACNQAEKEQIALVNTFSKVSGPKLVAGFKSVITSIGAILTSAGTWIMAAIAAITMAISHFANKSRELKVAVKDMTSAADKDVAEINRVMSKYQGNVMKMTRSGGRIQKNDITFDRDAMKTLNLGYELEEMRGKLQAMSPFYDGDLVDIYKMRTQEEQFEAIIRKMESYRLSNDLLAANSDIIRKGAKGSLFSENLLTNLTDYAKRLREIDVRVNRKIAKGKIGEEDLLAFEGNNVGERAEKMRELFVETLALPEKERKETIKSWDRGIRKIFKKVTDGTFKKSAEHAEQNIDKNIEKLAERLRPTVTGYDFDTVLSYLTRIFSSFRADANLGEKEAEPYMDELARLIFNDKDYKEYMRRKFMSDFSKAMQEEASNNKNWTANEAYDAATGVIDQIKDKWKDAGRQAADYWYDGFDEELKNSARAMVIVREAWQAMLQGAKQDKDTGDWQYSDFWNRFSSKITSADASESLGTFMGDTMKKVFDETASELTNNLKPLKVKWGLAVDPDMEIKSSNLAALKKTRETIQEAYDAEADQNGARGVHLKDTLDNLNDLIALIEKGNELGFQYGEDKKKSGYQAEYEKRWDERIRIMKEAYDWYDKWEKKIGHTKALEKVNERYQDIFEEWRTDALIPLDFDVRDIADYQKYVEQIRDAALKMYEAQKNDKSKNNGQEALRVYRQAVSLLTDINFDNFTRTAEEFQSIMEKTMDDLQRRWSIFADIRDKTGNTELAATLSAVDSIFTTQADAMRTALEEAYKQAGGQGAISFDISLDKDAVRSMFKKALPGSEAIDSFIKGFEEWQKAEQEQEQTDVNVTVDLISSAVDVQSESRRIMGDYARQSASLYRRFPNGGAEFDRANSILNANTQARLVQAEHSYQFLMDGVTTMNLKAARQIKKDYEDALLEQLKAGTITAKQYADEIENINDKMRELENTPSYFRSFTQNGMQGVFENMRQRGRSDMIQGAAQLQDAQDMYRKADELLALYEGTGNAAGMREAADMFQMAQEAEMAGEALAAAGKEMAGGAGGALQTLAIIDAIINGINKMVQSLKNFADYVKQVNVALGRADADEWSDNDNFLYAFSNASQQAANGWNSLKEGDIVGALQGTYGSWAEWWKSYAEGEDKTREYQIKLSERQLKVLSNMESRLDAIAQRTLGYGGQTDDATLQNFRSKIDEWNKAQNGETYYTGSGFQKSAWSALGGVLLPMIGGKIAESMYDKQNTKEYSSPYSGATIAAMERALQSGNIYDAQLASKMMERDEYRKQLQKLDSMNKTDNDRIEETRQKLFEVENELRDFAQNLAKELWGIDIKGWADQISDALMNAFENGEDAAKAFEDVTRNIMQSVANNIVRLGIVEPMMRGLKEKLFGTTDEEGNQHGGVLTAEEIVSNPQAAAEKGITAAKQYMDDYGNAMLIAGKELYTGLNTALGGALTNPNTKTLSSSIQGTSEETSGLLAGYVATMMQDVAADRLMREQFINEIWPTFVKETMGAVITPLGEINRNVSAIRTAITDSEGMAYQIRAIYSILYAITTGTKSVYTE